MKWRAKQKNKKKLQRKRNWTKAVARSVADGIGAKVLKAEEASSH